jgi:hypothetical protein
MKKYIPIYDFTLAGKPSNLLKVDDIEAPLLALIDTKYQSEKLVSLIIAFQQKLGASPRDVLQPYRGTLPSNELEDEIKSIHAYIDVKYPLYTTDGALANNKVIVDDIKERYQQITTKFRNLISKIDRFLDRDQPGLVSGKPDTSIKDFILPQECIIKEIHSLWQYRLKECAQKLISRMEYEKTKDKDQNFAFYTEYLNSLDALRYNLNNSVAPMTRLENSSYGSKKKQIVEIFNQLAILKDYNDNKDNYETSYGEFVKAKNNRILAQITNFDKFTSIVSELLSKIGSIEEASTALKRALRLKFLDEYDVKLSKGTVLELKEQIIDINKKYPYKALLLKTKLNVDNIKSFYDKENDDRYPDVTDIGLIEKTPILTLNTEGKIIEEEKWIDSYMNIPYSAFFPKYVKMLDIINKFTRIFDSKHNKKAILTDINKLMGDIKSSVRNAKLNISEDIPVLIQLQNWKENIPAEITNININQVVDIDFTTIYDIYPSNTNGDNNAYTKFVNDKENLLSLIDLLKNVLTYKITPLPRATEATIEEATSVEESSRSRSSVRNASNLNLQHVGRITTAYVNRS